ncbi:sugar ABC transporter permease, partial [Microbacterium sp. NRRL B-14842]|uniref:carbohydrate ABC transporter permease n=1 Tax=Microbacterium sp. NRRL B-14842 TaxID=3162881 RepID=UPI003D29B475
MLRGLMLIPWLIPGVVVSFLWMWIFNANYGVLNAALETVGLIDSPQAWLANPTTAMIAVIVAKTWQSFPWMMVMLLAGLQTVPIELHEAAEIDGAGTIRRFFSITVPQMSGIIGLVILLEFIWNFQHFDIIYVLTGGGPAGSTQTFATRRVRDRVRRLRPRPRRGDRPALDDPADGARRRLRPPVREGREAMTAVLTEETVA